MRPVHDRMLQTVVFAGLALTLADSLVATSVSWAAGNPLQTTGTRFPSNTEKVQHPKPSLETIALPQGTAYLFRIPARSPFKVFPVVSKSLAGVDSPIWSTFYPDAKPLYLINAGYFDPKNQLTTSYIFQNGMLVGDPRLNTDLTGNPKLTAYLPKIYNRSEFRTYLCKNKDKRFHNRYEITPRNGVIPDDCVLKASVGAGPSLLPRLTDLDEGFVDYSAPGKISRDPIGVSARNARSAVGLTDKGDVLILMASQNPENPKGSGFTLAEVASLLKAHGAVQALSLDGGSSSGFYYNGKTTYGKWNADKTPVKRPVKSVLMVTPQ